jgi:hypothetical protein
VFGQYLTAVKEKKVKYVLNSDLIKTESRIQSLFSINISDLKVGSNALVFFLNDTILYRIFRKLIQLFPWVTNLIFVESAKDPKVVSSDCKYLIFDGYWQNIVYLNYLTDNNIFSIKLNAPQNDFVDRYSQIIINENSIGIHIRRGDYLKKKNKSIYEICSFDYYLKAMSYISSKVSKPTYFIFSNDITWVQENFPVGKHKVFYVSASNSDDAQFNEFYLMSLCKHNIIANSTFSWWAAYLNSNSEKVVIAPSRWYKGKKNLETFKLIPTSWVRI